MAASAGFIPSSASLEPALVRAARATRLSARRRIRAGNRTNKETNMRPLLEDDGRGAACARRGTRRTRADRANAARRLPGGPGDFDRRHRQPATRRSTPTPAASSTSSHSATSSGTVTQAHIHLGQRGVSGGIAAWLCGTATIPGTRRNAGLPGATAARSTGTIMAANVVGSGRPATARPRRVRRVRARDPRGGDLRQRPLDDLNGGRDPRADWPHGTPGRTGRG